MTEQERAAEHLKVIRSLMERATVYRAISWPAALFGGGLGVTIAAALYFRAMTVTKGDGAAGPLISDGAWIGVWVAAMLVAGVFNILLIARQSWREGRPFISPGLKLAIRAIAPPMAAGGLIGIGSILWFGGSVAGAAAIWAMCYGLALLATQGLAPKSMPRLGWVVLIAGAGAYAWNAAPALGWGAPLDAGRDMMRANLTMGVCFGIFHLVYGFIVAMGSRGGESADDAA